MGALQARFIPWLTVRAARCSSTSKWQYAIAEMEGTTYGQNGHGIPALTYEEMAGLVLGYDPGSWACRCTRSDMEPC